MNILARHEYSDGDMVSSQPSHHTDAVGDFGLSQKLHADNSIRRDAS